MRRAANQNWLCALLGKRRDLHEASFAGGGNVPERRGREGLLRRVHACYRRSSPTAINYAHGSDTTSSGALSVGVSRWSAPISELGGISRSGHRVGLPNVIPVSGAYGLASFVVAGSRHPDAWTVFKPTRPRHRAIIGRRSERRKCVLSTPREQGTRSEPTPRPSARASADRAMCSRSPNGPGPLKTLLDARRHRTDGFELAKDG